MSQMLIVLQEVIKNTIVANKECKNRLKKIPISKETTVVTEWDEPEIILTAQPILNNHVLKLSLVT